MTDPPQTPPPDRLGELDATLANVGQPDEHIVVNRADPVVLASAGLVADWRSDDRSPHVHYREDGGVETVMFGTEGHGVGVVTYQIHDDSWRFSPPAWTSHALPDATEPVSAFAEYLGWISSDLDEHRRWWLPDGEDHGPTLGTATPADFGPPVLIQHVPDDTEPSATSYVVAVDNRPDDLSALADAVEDTPLAEYLLAILADRNPSTAAHLPVHTYMRAVGAMEPTPIPVLVAEMEQLFGPMTDQHREITTALLDGIPCLHHPMSLEWRFDDNDPPPC